MRRIVSLLPSATEIVYALGGGNSLVGVSHECDFPREAMTKPKIIEPIFDSGTLASDQIDRLVSQSLQKGERLYRIKLDELKKADPDLIITQELCDVCAIGAADVLEAVNQLGKRVEVISLNPHSLTDVKQDIRKVADALGLGENAERLVDYGLSRVLHDFFGDFAYVVEELVCGRDLVRLVLVAGGVD